MAPSPRRAEQLLDSERTLIAVRWFGVPFALLQVQTYNNMPYPPGVQEAGFALAGVLAAINLAAMLAARRVRGDRTVLALSVATLVADAAVLVGFVWLFTFDNVSTMFLMLFILPAEAALKFQLRGALGLWGVVTAAYAAREAWGAAQYGFEFSGPSISYRMGILLMISLIVGLFARHLRRRTDELEREKQWHSALIDMLAHDFRAPVGAATSGLLVVARRLDELPPATIRDMVEAAVRQNRRALALADDLLALARAGHGRLELNRQDVEIRPLLDRVVAWLGMTDSEVRIESPQQQRAFVDAARLKQIVTNLLANAHKHGRPPVTVTSFALPDGGIEVRVADSGDGVPDEQHADLFRQFASGPRADSVGLGLWLVATLAEAHDGDVRYVTTEDRPTFIVRIPGVVGGDLRPTATDAGAGTVAGPGG